MHIHVRTCILFTQFIFLRVCSSFAENQDGQAMLLVLNLTMIGPTFHRVAQHVKSHGIKILSGTFAVVGIAVYVHFKEENPVRAEGFLQTDCNDGNRSKVKWDSNWDR